MIAKTHVSFALSVSSVSLLLVSFVAQVDYDARMLILFLGGIAIGALLPDIDEPNSRIGRKTIFISHIIKKVFGHRGATHTLLFPLVIGGLCYPLFVYFHFSKEALFGLVIGAYLHIVGDMMTKRGCPIYLPISSRNVGLIPKSLRFMTGGMIDHALGHVCMAIFILCSAYFAGFDLSWLSHINMNQFLRLLG